MTASSFVWLVILSGQTGKEARTTFMLGRTQWVFVSVYRVVPFSMGQALLCRESQQSPGFDFQSKSLRITSLLGTDATVWLRAECSQGQRDVAWRGMCLIFISSVSYLP